MQKISQYSGVVFPDHKDLVDGISGRYGSIELHDDVIKTENISSVPGW